MSHLALHVCCGPCMIVPLGQLLERFDRITVVYANSNIHPQSEYEKRRDVAATFAHQLGADFVELPYEPLEWFAAIKHHDRRCLGCYEMRLDAVAQWAQNNNADMVSTVLTISPYQDAEAIASIGERVCDTHGVAYLSESFVALYPESITRSKAEGMYRQKYCGCVYSLEESLRQQEEKALRAQARAEEKAQRRHEAEENKRKKELKREHDRAH